MAEKICSLKKSGASEGAEISFVQMGNVGSGTASSRTITGLDTSKTYYVVLCEGRGGTANNATISNITQLSNVGNTSVRFITMRPTATSITISYSSSSYMLTESVWLVS